MPNIFKPLFGDIAGGRVLDVATGEGGFVRILAKSLKSYAEIVGVDVSKRNIEAARSASNQETFQFMPMCAEQLDFENESFDTVSISASLHHLANVGDVLVEMKRVLKPGGHFIIAEMHRDGQTEAQLTVVYLHHWKAKIDSVLGALHNSTLTRQELVDHVDGLELCNVEFHDFSDIVSDPMDEARVRRLESLTDSYLQCIERLPRHGARKRRGEELRQQLHEVGAQSEPWLIVIGKKQ